MLWGRILTAELAADLCSSTHNVGVCVRISYDCIFVCVCVCAPFCFLNLIQITEIRGCKMAATKLPCVWKLQPCIESCKMAWALVKKLPWKRFRAHFCLLVPSKTSQTQQFTRGGMFLCSDFTLYSSLRCLKNASDKYWMSKRQHNCFKCRMLFECQLTHCGYCGISVISDSPF